MFGHERPSRKARPSIEPTRAGKEAAVPGKWKSHEQVLEEMLEAELDPSRRPRQKVSPTWTCVNIAELGALWWGGAASAIAVVVFFGGGGP